MKMAYLNQRVVNKILELPFVHLLSSRANKYSNEHADDIPFINYY